MYLLACPDTKFSEIAEIINPENVFQIGFFNLYSEVTTIRAERGRSLPEKGKKDFKCNIF